MWVYEREASGVVNAQLALPVGVDQEDDVRLYRIAFPFLPPSKNVIDNWPGEWKRAVKKKWERWIAQECEALAMPKGVAQVGLAATLVFPTNARRDTQNYAQSLWHFVPDGLVKAGVLLDDRDGCVVYGPNLSVRFEYDLRRGVPRKKRERTIVAITMAVPTEVEHG